jgi:hypothetical protein
MTVVTDLAAISQVITEEAMSEAGRRRSDRVADPVHKPRLIWPRLSRGFPPVCAPPKDDHKPLGIYDASPRASLAARASLENATDLAGVKRGAAPAALQYRRNNSPS